MRIYVTKKDLKNGTRNNCKKCPVAIAVNRRLGEKVYAVVLSDRCGIFSKNNAIRQETYFLSERVRDRILDFDTLKDVKPFSFTLPLGEFT